MNIDLNALESIILNWVSMDYETIETIIGNVVNDYGKDMSREQLHNVLLDLCSKELVASYIYSYQDKKYVAQAPIGQYPQTDIWWYITDKGKDVIRND